RPVSWASPSSRCRRCTRQPENGSGHGRPYQLPPPVRASADARHPQEAEGHMSAMPAGEGRSAQVPGETTTTVPTRRARLRAVAAARGVPLPAILVTVAVVVL